MNDDYLWDKSGEPDPEIQELEEILKPLRYQPKPLELPREVRRRNYLPLAVAATILIALLIAGVWLRLRREAGVSPQQRAEAERPVLKDATPAPAPLPEAIVRDSDLQRKPAHKRKNRVFVNKREREEALAAKEQVMLALRLASEKLKLAQRRTQGPFPNQIKNQHRVG